MTQGAQQWETGGVSPASMGKYYRHIIDLPEEEEKLLWSLVCLLVFEAIKRVEGNPDLARDQAFDYLARHDLSTIKDEIMTLLPEFAGVLKKRCKITKTNARALLIEGLHVLNVNRLSSNARSLFIYAFMSFPGGKIE